MGNFLEGIFSIVMAIITLALIATLVSRNARTPEVAQSFFSGIGNSIAVAQSPVSGAAVAINLGYPGADFGGFGFGS